MKHFRRHKMQNFFSVIDIMPSCVRRWNRHIHLPPIPESAVALSAAINHPDGVLRVRSTDGVRTVASSSYLPPALSASYSAFEDSTISMCAHLNRLPSLRSTRDSTVRYDGRGTDGLKGRGVDDADSVAEPPWSGETAGRVSSAGHGGQSVSRLLQDQKPICHAVKILLSSLERRGEEPRWSLDHPLPPGQENGGPEHAL